ncbi:unnamed protein product [Lepeophtheirus salmonis]|uniref:(salmon louse) hypothetical protein n=1 Tax=Lepeophtheirus salmonis TaxID=72036 RepID=A0A7R8CVA2_LEPSM|nr:unnamed protein product [Lepeophtheirus salmonis]CAF2941660.1 unnamed protein product [Lepeophtheirus salmonis]
MDSIALSRRTVIRRVEKISARSHESTEGCKTWLEWNKMANVTIDGACVLTGKNVELLKLMNDRIKAENPGRALIPLHCVIHQESLAKGLALRLFQELQADLETEHFDVLYHNHIRRLSLGKVLRIVWELREETVMFLEMKNIQCDFSANVVDEESKNLGSTCSKVSSSVGYFGYRIWQKVPRLSEPGTAV